MKHIIIEDTDQTKFLDKLEVFCTLILTKGVGISNNIINIAYSTNTIQTIEVIESKEYPQLEDYRKEVVKTNYSALIQYT